MKCSWVRERLCEYLDGSLQDGDARSIEAHLRSCPDCAAELESVKSLDARLREEIPAQWESIQPSPAFMARLRNLDLEPAPSPTTRLANWLFGSWQSHRAVATATLVICILIAVGVTVPQMISRESGKDESESMIANAPESPALTAQESAPEAGAGKAAADDDGYRGLTSTMPAATPEPEGAPSFAWETPAEETKPARTPAPVPPPVETLAPTPSEPGDYSAEKAEDTTASVSMDWPAPTTAPMPTPTPTMAPPPSVTPTPTPSPATGGEGTTIIAAKPKTAPFFRPLENQTAVWIALGNPDVQKAMEGETLQGIVVSQDAETGMGECVGSTVTLELATADSRATTLYICVDLESHQVTEVKPLRG